ncbi:HNH endonuclease [Arthrobacter sp. Hz1]
MQAQAAALAASRSGSGSQIGNGLGFTLSAEELAPLLNISGRAAHRLLGQSLNLVLDLPKTLHCLGRGMISVRQAQLIADEALFLPAEVLPGFEDQVLARGAHLTPPRLRATCHRVRERLHPESSTTRKAAAALDRHVEVTPAHDGMAWLSAYLPAEQACVIEHRLTFTARALQNPSESRTLTQLKADVFSDLLTHHCPPTESTHHDDADADGAGGAADGRAGTGDTGGAGGGGGLVDLASVKGVQPVVFVTVPVLTLLGGDGPADLEGYGPIDPDTARQLAAHAPGFIRILTHPETGTVLSVGRDRYKVPQGLRTTILVRDKTCLHPGCNRPAPACDIDHTIPWHQGGTTSYDNLAALCRRHHMLKTEGYWHYEQPEPGTIAATSLTGKNYTTLPQPPPF